MPRGDVHGGRAHGPGGVPGVFDEAHCEECSVLAPPDPSGGWIAIVAPDGSEVWYCPVCAAREFGRPIESPPAGA